jgi:hypothetical protein
MPPLPHEAPRPNLDAEQLELERQLEKFKGEVFEKAKGALPYHLEFGRRATDIVSELYEVEGLDPEVTQAEAILSRLRKSDATFFYTQLMRKQYGEWAVIPGEEPHLQAIIHDGTVTAVGLPFAEGAYSLDERFDHMQDISDTVTFTIEGVWPNREDDFGTWTPQGPIE